MQIGGKELPKGRYKDFIVFPRPEGENIVLWAQALDDEWEQFEENYPMPKPPVVFKPQEGHVEDEDDEGYKGQMKAWTQLKMNFCMIQSITVPSEITWERVKEDDPGTWAEWRKELRESGVTVTEVQAVFNKVLEVNGLNQQLVEKARKAFLAGQQSQ